jgi:hypothetical protein
VRVLWVPHCNCQVQRLLGVLVDRGLGHPIGAPIRICFAQILRGSRFEPAKLRCSRWSVVSQTLLMIPWRGTRGSDFVKSRSHLNLLRTCDVAAVVPDEATAHSQPHRFQGAQSFHLQLSVLSGKIHQSCGAYTRTAASCSLFFGAAT